MRIMRKGIFLVFILYLLVALQGFFIEGTYAAQRIEGFVFRQTIITPYTLRRIIPGKNMFFCAAFQMAWNKLTTEVTREPIQLAGKPIVLQMLNRRLNEPSDIPENYYLAMAGFGSDNISEKIRLALREKFNDSPGMDLGLVRPHDILVYAYFTKEVSFEEEFEGLNRIMFSGKSAVKAFGLKEFVMDETHIRVAEQVKIVDYRNQDNFILRFYSALPSDEIIVAKVPPQTTFSGTIDAVMARVAASRPTPLRIKETLQVPALDFDILDWYIEIEGRSILNRGLEDYLITKAIQNTKFKFLQAAPPFELYPSEAEAKTGVLPRKFIVDKPFLIYVKEENARYPYLAIWVENTELLLAN